MRSLTEVYEQIQSKDVILEKQAAELLKQAEEEDAAGRIMARGFADELAKLAGAYDGGASAFDTGPKGGALQRPGGTIKSGPFSTGGGNTGANYDPFKRGRSGAAAGAAAAAGGTSTKPVGAP